MDRTTIPRLLTVKEVATMLNVRPSWVYAKVASREIPHMHVGRYPRFDVGEVIAWVRGRDGAA